MEKPQEEDIPQWDEKNPLCPRTVRSNGEVRDFCLGVTRQGTGCSVEQRYDGHTRQGAR